MLLVEMVKLFVNVGGCVARLFRMQSGGKKHKIEVRSMHACSGAAHRVKTRTSYEYYLLAYFLPQRRRRPRKTTHKTLTK
jgi:hypothetical protein